MTGTPMGHIAVRVDPLTYFYELRQFVRKSTQLKTILPSPPRTVIRRQEYHLEAATARQRTKYNACKEMTATRQLMVTIFHGRTPLSSASDGTIDFYK